MTPLEVYPMIPKLLNRSRGYVQIRCKESLGDFLRVSSKLRREKWIFQ
jgi:hypothetical protein